MIRSLIFSAVIILQATFVFAEDKSVLDFGAVMNDRTAASKNSTALQAAIDSWGFPYGDVGNTVTIPPGDLYIDKDIFLDRNSVGIRGAGKSNTFIRKASYQEGAVIRVGMSRGTKTTPAIDLNHWPSATGKLDSSVGTVPRWGINLNGDSHVSFSPFPWCNAPGFWGKTSVATIEMILEGPVPATQLIGSSTKNIPDPITVVTTPTQIQVYWSTVDDTGSLTGRKRWSATAPATIDAGIHTLVIQISLNPQSACIWKDGVLLTTTSNMVGMPTTFGDSQNTPWAIGHAATCATNYVSDYFNASSLSTHSIYGLRISSVARYKTGVDLARLDDKPITHKSLCFDKNEVGVLGLLPGTETPENMALIRGVPVDSQSGRSYGMVISPWHGGSGGVNSIVSNNSIQDLSLVSFAYGGDALLLGGQLNFTAKSVAFLGADNGVSDWHWGVNYTNKFYDCGFSGKNSCYYNWYGINKFRDCEIGNDMGRVTFWIVMGYMENYSTFCAGFGTPVNFYRGTLATTSIFRDVLIDIENAKYPSNATFYAETTGDRGNDAGSLTIDGMNGGSFLATQPLVKLVDKLKQPLRPGYVDLRGSWVVSSKLHPAVVDTEANWIGNIAIKKPQFPVVIGPGAPTINVLMPQVMVAP